MVNSEILYRKYLLLKGGLEKIETTEESISTLTEWMSKTEKEIFGKLKSIEKEN